MIQERAIISDIQKTKQMVENLGAVFNGDYIFKDKIFISGNKNDSNYFLRIRIYLKNNWPTKNVVLIKVESKSSGQINIFFRQEFDAEQDAVNFIKQNFSDFKYAFEYSREGWLYDLGKTRIFIENIEELKPSIEIEAGSEEEIQSLFGKLGAGKKIESVFQEIRRIKYK